MPIEYEGTLSEHRAVRDAAGIFDLTHLGKVEVHGPGAFEWLQRVITNDLGKIQLGQAQYNLILNDQGGIVDDLIVYWDTPDAFLVVPNAANIEPVLEALRDGVPEDVTIRHRADLTTIAVQGPNAPDLVGGMFKEATSLAYMTSATVEHRDETMMLARSGYTGEHGYELFATADVAVDLWRALLEAGRDAGLKPAGLGARDTLRLEMGYPLYGQELTRARTPIEAGLRWACDLEGGVFAGVERLRREASEGTPERLTAFELAEPGIPRPGQAVVHEGRPVGTVTSGTLSPMLGVGIGLAYVESALATPDVPIAVDVRGKLKSARTARRPLVGASPRST
jgi:aminomethyltransferase